MIRPGTAAALLLALSSASGALESVSRVVGHSLGAPVSPIGKLLQPSWSAISPQARIFLVAGGRDSANFAQEIADQKKFWLAHGYTSKQIECFYAVPPADQEDDADQFLSLEADLRNCHLAAPHIIFAALAQVATKYRQDFLYLYVSSHGTDPPLTQRVPRQVLRSPGAAWFVEARGEATSNPQSQAWQWFSPYRMEVEGTGNVESWSWTSFEQRYLGSRQNPDIRAEDQLFTPKNLAQVLQKFPVKVRKLVVLQACHSGGFLLPAEEAPEPAETLVTVQNITVLAAARADRTSFGCDTAEHTTYYGGALQEVLNASGKKIPVRDWRAIHDEVSTRVEALEAEQKIPENQRSLPQYFSNIPVPGKK